MTKLHEWVVEFGQTPAMLKLARRLAPFADRSWFSALAGGLAFIATLTFSIPFVPILSTFVAVDRRRWLQLALWAVLGSATAGALFTHVLGHLGTEFITEKLPQLVASKHWHLLVKWVSSYGFISLAAIAASPIADTPALILAALLGMPWFEVFASLTLGKGVKYIIIAALTAKAAGQVIDYYELEDAKIIHQQKTEADES